jgi:hypothetical protein
LKSVFVICTCAAPGLIGLPDLFRKTEKYFIGVKLGKGF